jgi:hypothetical protein
VLALAHGIVECFSPSPLSERDRARRVRHPFATRPRGKRNRTLAGKALEVLAPEQVWVNPDCGLKTRDWKEVRAALTNMVDTARKLRRTLDSAQKSASRRFRSRLAAKHVEDSNLSRTRAEALLDDQVKRLADASESVTNALRKPVVRGSWDEMTPENALENAGLEAEIDFILQHYTDGEDGRKRTNAITNLPKGRKLIIDSKNLMESYIALANAEDEAQRSVLADIHSKSFQDSVVVGNWGLKQISASG